MKFAEFKNIIESKWAEKFAGKCIINFYKEFGKYIIINFYISPVMTVTWLNDMLHFNLMIELPENFNQDDNLPELLTISATHNSYNIKPEKPYLCYSSRRIPFRQSKGTPEKILNNIEKSIEKIHAMLLEDLAAGNIHEVHIDILKENIK